MSVLVKDMKLPPSCNLCEFSETYIHADGEEEIVCQFTLSPMNYHQAKTRADNCPLIEIKPHGRLIDADAFLAEQRHLYCENCARRKGMKNGKMKFVYDIGDAPCRACGYGDVLDDIEDAPTIIEAEECET